MKNYGFWICRSKYYADGTESTALLFGHVTNILDFQVTMTYEFAA